MGAHKFLMRINKPVRSERILQMKTVLGSEK
jgi:hypothetical protein